jgi:hypothetical protein
MGAADLLDFDADAAINDDREAAIRRLIADNVVPFMRENLAVTQLRVTVRETKGVAIRKCAWEVLEYNA